MPRDANSNYSLPSIYLAQTGETIEAEQHNTPLEDVAAALTGSLARNGTGAMTGALKMGGNKITGAAAASADTDLVTKGQMDAAIAAAVAAAVAARGVPLGMLAFHAVGTPVPSGWLLCDGQAVSRTTYAALFGTIETVWGAGNGTTTFNVPDLRGEFLRGFDFGRGVDPGRVFGSIQQDAFESHSHAVTDPGHVHETPGGPNAPGSGTEAPAGQSGNTFLFESETASAGTGISIQSTGGTETRPRNVAVAIIIKT